MEIKGKYIDPFTDFGFKKLFGSEPNKDLLIYFLNELLKGKKEIKALTYAKNEHLGKRAESRKAVFDLHCENEQGEKFIIELQKMKQKYFRDRSVYYATFPLQEQAPNGQGWDYQLKELYTIGIMDFTFDDYWGHPDRFRYDVKLADTETGAVFYDKLTFIYLEMPKFDKKEADLKTHFDKWMYLLKNLNKFTEIPVILQERIFRKLFSIAEVANLNEEEMRAYEASLKDKRDWKNALDTALEEGMQKGIQKGIQKGLEQGIEKGRIEEKRAVARQLKKDNMPMESIARVTGLSIEEINKL